MLRRIRLALLLPLLLLPRTASAQVQPHSPTRAQDVAIVQDAVWIGTDRGLYQYRPSENVWSTRSRESGLLSNTITRLGVDQEALWIGTDRGISRYDLRSNTVLSYDTTAGFPSGRVLSLAFDADYVWAGTEHGAARYDRLIEQWQRIGAAQGLAGSRVFAIAPVEGLVYMITDSAVCEYDPKYERWRVFGDEQGGVPVRDAFIAGGSAWMLRDADMLRFDFATRVLRRYPLGDVGGFSAIRNIIIEGASFWIAGRDQLWQYDAQSDALRPFLEISGLPDRDIRCVGFSAGGGGIAFATASGLSLYDRGAKTWTFLTASSGMPVTEYRALFPGGDGVIGRDDAQFVTWNATENRWRSYPLLSAAAGTSPSSLFTLDPARGTYADFGDGIKLSLTGTRASWLNEWRDGIETNASRRLDLKAKLELGNERSINAAYNDADYSDLQYGVQYRGAKEDVLQTAQWGDLRAEHGDRTLLQSFGIFGGGGRLVIGSRTPKYHRGLLEIAGAAGHQTTRLTAEFFQGRSKAFSKTLADIGYVQRRFFAIDSMRAAAAGSEEASTLRVYTIPAGGRPTNNVFEGRIAGIDGAWVEFAHVFDQERGIIRLGAPLAKGQPLAARFRRNGAEVEVLLASAAGRSPYELQNVYAFAGSAVLPGSLGLTIRDTATGAVPLSRFRLDADGDGRVDPPFVDAQAGLLFFPEQHPFAATAYADSAVSNATLTFQYETLGNSFPLAHTQLIRGSERVLVDGLLVRAGDDYILDYTNGFLLFTRDGAINDDSRIEVGYEFVEHKTDRKYAQATATLSPSDLAQASVSAVRLTAADRSGDVYLVHAAVEGRYQSDHADVRVVPEFSRSARQDGAGSNAYGFTAAASSGALRFSAMGRRLEDGYVQMYEKRYSQGVERTTGNARAEYDVTSALRLFAGWQVRNGYQLVSRAFSRDDAADAGIKANLPDLPALTVRWQRLSDLGARGASVRQALRGDLDYVLPASLLEALAFSAGSLTSYARYARENRDLPAGGTSERDVRNYYLRATMSPRPLFIVNAYYRGDAERMLDRGALTPFLTDEKINADVIVEHVRGLSLTLRGSDAYRRMYALGPGGFFDGDDRSSMQASARFSPGVIATELQPFTVELNTRQDRSAYHADATGNAGMFTALFTAADGVLASKTASAFWEGKVEWRPSADVLSVSTARSTGTTTAVYATHTSGQAREFVQRLDVRPDPMTFVSAQGAWYNTSSPGSTQRRIAPSLWLERRWSRLVITRATGAASFSRQEYGRDEIRSDQYTTGANITLLLDRVPVIEKLETRYDITWSAQSTHGIPVYSGSSSEQRSLSNTLSIDVYPFASSYFRFAGSYAYFLASEAVPSQHTTSMTMQIVIQL